MTQDLGDLTARLLQAARSAGADQADAMARDVLLFGWEKARRKAVLSSSPTRKTCQAVSHHRRTHRRRQLPGRSFIVSPRENHHS